MTSLQLSLSISFFDFGGRGPGVWFFVGKINKQLKLRYIDRDC
jgi:hypothetical protein